MMRHLMCHHGVRIGGYAYLIGNLILIIIGGIGSSWREVATSLANIAAGIGYTQGYFRLGGLLAMLGQAFFIPSQPPTITTAIMATLVISGQMLIVFEPHLSKINIRPWVCLLLSVGRVAMIINNWGTTMMAVALAWLTGDLCVGLSRKAPKTT